VPDKFKAVHITQLSGGEPTPEFVGRLRELLSAHERGSESPS